MQQAGAASSASGSPGDRCRLQSGGPANRATKAHAAGGYQSDGSCSTRRRAYGDQQQHRPFHHLQRPADAAVQFSGWDVDDF